jgi:dodecin
MDLESRIESLLMERQSLMLSYVIDILICPQPRGFGSSIKADIHAVKYLLTRIERSYSQPMIERNMSRFIFSVFLMTHVAKIIEIVGSSEKSWQDAAQSALNEAKKTIHGITGVEVGDMTAKVDPNNGNITEYHTAVKIAFGVEHS